MAGLNAKQARFVAEYLVDLNGKQAAIRAGYSPRSAEVTASKLLRVPKVQEAVSAGQQARAEKTGITAERVLGELALIGFANMSDYVRVTSQGDAFVCLSSLTREQAAAIAEVTVEDFVDGRGEDARDVRRLKFRLADKRAALVDLGRHLGLFVDRKREEGPGGGAVQVEHRVVDLTVLQGLAARAKKVDADG